MSVAVYKDGKLLRHFPNLIDASIFVDATVEEIAIAQQDGKTINGYKVETEH